MGTRVRWGQADGALAREFCGGALSASQRYEHLFRYVISGFLSYRTPAGSGARYPGAPSWNGARVDAMEGFTRVCPLLAAWLAGGHAPRVRTLWGEAVDLREVLAAGLLAGTDPASPGYWGDVEDYGQPVCEAADVALALWLSRRELWDCWGEADRARVARWLGQVPGRTVHDNNWHLFPILVAKVLEALDHPSDGAGLTQHFARVQAFHLGDGWFRDGADGRVDYYNAWGFHYALGWLHALSPDYEAAFITDVLSLFAEGYRHFFSPAGLPIMGRSICYRMAAPVPLVAAALDGSAQVTPGLARRALDAVWQHFISHGAMQRGRPTQGYYGADLRLLDRYSGPASPLWSLRSLVPAFSAAWGSPFWTAPDEPLRVETDDYRVPIPAVGWEVTGCRATAEVCIVIAANAGRERVRLKRHGLLRRARELVSHRPRRPPNMAAKYGLHVYSSMRPFFCA